MTNYKLRRTADLDIFKVTIVGDYDAKDYISSTECYSKDKFDKVIYPALLDLLENASDDFKLEDYDSIILKIPRGDLGQCHTLMYVEVEYIDSEGTLWKVKLLDE